MDLTYMVFAQKITPLVKANMTRVAVVLSGLERPQQPRSCNAITCTTICRTLTTGQQCVRNGIGIDMDQVDKPTCVKVGGGILQ